MSDICSAVVRGGFYAEILSGLKLCQKQAIDEALIKRFDEHVNFALPALYAEVLIVCVHVKAYFSGSRCKLL